MYSRIPKSQANLRMILTLFYTSFLRFGRRLFSCKHATFCMLRGHPIHILSAHFREIPLLILAHDLWMFRISRKRRPLRSGKEGWYYPNVCLLRLYPIGTQKYIYLSKRPQALHIPHPASSSTAPLIKILILGQYTTYSSTIVVCDHLPGSQSVLRRADIP